MNWYRSIRVRGVMFYLVSTEVSTALTENIKSGFSNPSFIISCSKYVKKNVINAEHGR
jgi:hypothetical protein